MSGSFDGAKLALFLGESLLVYLRDDKPDIPWPGYWDFPGGGREGVESPADCVLRETYEEFGLRLGQSDLTWGRRHYNGSVDIWFFLARMPGHLATQVKFGDEGQFWRCMSVDDYLSDHRAIPHLQRRLTEALNSAV